MMGAEIDAGIEGLGNGLADARVRMAIDAGRIFAKEVDIGVAVDIGDDGTLAASDADRHRRGVEDGAGIAARHHPLGASARSSILDQHYLSFWHQTSQIIHGWPREPG